MCKLLLKTNKIDDEDFFGERVIYDAIFRKTKLLTEMISS